MYLDRFRLDGKVAVVTGGAQGIGFACCEALREAGAVVVVADRNRDGAEAARAKLGGRAEAVGLEVTQPASVETAADTVLRRLGRIDVLVNNAGIARSEIRAEDYADADWLDLIDVNLNGAFWCCRAFGKRMLAAGRGSIVNVGSMSGEIANTPQEQTSYNVSKAGVHHLTRSLAAEWAPRGVRVNAVAPTYIETAMTREAMQKPMAETWLRMTPMGRVGQPEEIASVVLFLAGDASSLMTGAIVLADGGYTCW
jgi:NAD(P)-dependent dehydrogenase (short-subunit alcohol dehydrogenase family)